VPAAEVSNGGEAARKQAKGKAKLKARGRGLGARTTGRDGPLQPEGSVKAGKGDSEAGKVGDTRMGLPGGLATTQRAPKGVDALEVNVEEGLMEQDSAQTTQGKASIVHPGRGTLETEDDFSRERQSKNAAESLADCLAEIDEFLKDS